MQRQIRENKSGNYDVAFKYRLPFTELRDAQMGEIASSLRNNEVEAREVWPDVCNFLGYAPVLSVLSEFLAVANPQATRSADMRRGSSSDAILLKIIDSILLREQGKFVAQTTDVFRSTQSASEGGTPDYSRLYSSREQAIRIIARVFNCQLDASKVVTLPRSLVEAYEGACGRFIADHPFWAGNEIVNIVFNDYLNARAAVDDLCSQALTPVPDRSRRHVGPYFHQFVHEFAPRQDDVPVVSDQDLPALIDSHALALGDSANVVACTYYDTADIDGVLLLSDTNGVSDSPLEFVIKKESEMLFLTDRFSRGVIVTTSMVILGQRGSRFLLGPDANILASEVVIDSDALSVNLSRRSGDVGSCIVGSRREAIQTPGLQSVEATHPDAFTVVSEWVRPVLQPFKRHLERRSVVTVEEYIDFRAVLRTFRQGGGTRPSVYYEKLDQRIVKNSPERSKILRRLIEENIVMLDRTQYYLNTNALAEYGVNLQMIVSGEPNDPVASLIERLIR